MTYPLITNVHLNLTHRCNLACRYCYVHQSPLDMSWQVAKDSVDFLAKNSKVNGVKPVICFFGGEPLLMYKELIVPVVEYVEKTYPELGFYFTMTTNSVLLTDDKIEFFRQHKIGIHTSIDGCAETQNYNRPLHGGGESFPIIEPHIKKVLANGMGFTFRSTVIPATCQHSYQNYLYAISLGYKAMFAITNAYEKWDAEHEKVLEQEYYKIADHYIAYWREHKKAPIRLSMLEKFMSVHKRDIKAQQHNNSATHCGLGRSGVAAISPTGNIYGCQEMTSNEGEESIFYIGNIYTGVIDERRQKLSDLYDSCATNGDMDCSKCEANVMCNGGCVANNYMITGRLNDCPHGHCFFQRILSQVAKYIVKELKDIPEFDQSFNNVGKNVKHTSNDVDKSALKSCKNCDSCQNCDVCQNHDS